MASLDSNSSRPTDAVYFKQAEVAELAKVALGRSYSSAEYSDGPVFNPYVGSSYRRTGIDSLADMMTQRPPDVKGEAVYNPILSKSDLNINAPLHSYTVNHAAVDTANPDGVALREAAGLARLKRSSRNTAAQMVIGEKPTGYVVLTDATRAQLDPQFMENVGPYRGAMFQIDSEWTGLDSVRLTLTPHGHKAGVTKYLTHTTDMDRVTARKFLRAFSPISAKQAALHRVQNRIIEKTRALRNIRRLADYDVFESLIQTGFTPRGGEEEGLGGFMAQGIRGSIDRALYPFMPQGAIVKKYKRFSTGPEANPKRANVFQKTIGGRRDFVTSRNASAQAVFHAFNQSADTAYDRLSATPGWQLHNTETREQFKARKWKMFITPVLDRASTKINMPFSPGGGPVSVLNGSVFTEKGGLHRAVIARAVQTGIYKSRAIHGVDDIGIRTLMAGENIGEQSGLKSETNYIRQRLRILDDLENKHNPIKIHDRIISQHRTSAFSRLQSRVDDMLTDLSKDGQHFTARYDFQDAEPLSGRGYGIHVSIVPQGVDKIVAGDITTGAQIFMPIVDLNHEYTTPGGQRVAARMVGIRTDVMEDSTIAPWAQEIETVSQGFYHQRELGYEFGVGKGAGYVFSAQQVIAANMGTRLGRVKSYLRVGQYDRVTSEMSLGLATATKLIGKNTSGMLDDELWKQGVATPREFMSDVFNFAATPATSVNDTIFNDWMNGREFGIKIVTGPNGTKTLIGKNSSKKLYLRSQAKLDEIIRLQAGDQTDPAAIRKARATVAKNLKKSIGRDIGYQIEHEYDMRAQFGRSIHAMQGTKAENDWVLTPMQYLENVLPGGIANVRPVQFPKAINLPRARGVSYRGRHTYLSTRGFNKWTSNTTSRNIDMAYVVGGEYIDEAGNVIERNGVRTLDSEDAIRAFGNYEQQGLISPAAEQIFNGADLHNAKMMFEESKNTMQVIGRDGNKFSWDNPEIMAFTGVPGPKTIEKHESLVDIQRGFLRRVLASSSVENKAALQTELTRLLGADSVVSANNGGLDVILRAGQTLPSLPELATLAKITGIDLFPKVIVTLADGKTRMRLSTMHILAQTRILSDSHWYTKLKAQERVFNTRKDGWMPGGNTSDDFKFGANDLNRLIGEGLSGHARMIAQSSTLAKHESGLWYELNQKTAAYRATFGADLRDSRNLAHLSHFANLNPTTVTLKDMAAAGRTQPLAGFQMSKDEYASRYGSGARQLDLTGHRLTIQVGDKKIPINTLYLPDELPKVTNGVYEATTLQRSQDRLLQALSGNDDNVTKKALESYERAFRKELAGKSGLFASTLKQISFDGMGVMKGPIANDLWAGADNKKLKPFEFAVSREYAEAMGAIEPRTIRPGLIAAKANSELAAFRAENAKRGYVYASVHRSPEVTPGRMGARMIIDDSLRGMQSHIHESLRDILIADFDGDQARVVMAGFSKYVNTNAADRTAIEAQFSREIERKAQNWTDAQANRIFKPGKMIENTQDGLDYVTSLARPKDQPRGHVARNMDELAKMVYDRRTTHAQGLMGSVIEPLQAYAMMMESKSATEEERKWWNMANRGGGGIREEVLKVKSKKRSDPWNIVRLFNGQESGPSFFKDDIRFEDLTKLDAKGDPVYNMESLFKAINHTWVEDYKDKDPEKFERYTAFRQMIEHLANTHTPTKDAPTFMQSQLFKDLRGNINPATADNASFDKVIAAAQDVERIKLGQKISGYGSTYNDFIHEGFNLPLDPTQQKSQLQSKRKVKNDIVPESVEPIVAPLSITTVPAVPEITAPLPIREPPRLGISIIDGTGGGQEHTIDELIRSRIPSSIYDQLAQSGLQIAVDPDKTNGTGIFSPKRNNIRLAPNWREDSVLHELGHAYDQILGKQAGYDSYLSLNDTHIQSEFQSGNFITDYSSKNVKEFFAENFAAAHSSAMPLIGPNQQPIGSRLHGDPNSVNPITHQMAHGIMPQPEDMWEGFDLHGSVPEPAQSMTEELLHSAQVTSEVMTAPAVESAAVRAAASQVETASDIIKKNRKLSPWIIGGAVAAGTLGLAGLTFQSGGSDRAPTPDMPASPPSGKTRVMVQGPGGSDSYNVQVRAKSSDEHDDQNYGQATSGLGPSSVNVNIRDHRASIDALTRQQFTNQMKGR